MIWLKMGIRLEFQLQKYSATAVIAVAISFYLLVRVSNPFSNPPVEENSGFTSTSIRRSWLSKIISSNPLKLLI